MRRGKQDRDGAPPKAWSRSIAAGRDIVKDTTAGLVASVVLIGNVVSFGALMFPGDLSAGIPVAIWAMLIGSCVGGLWIARLLRCDEVRRPQKLPGARERHLSGRRFGSNPRRLRQSRQSKIEYLHA